MIPPVAEQGFELPAGQMTGVFRFLLFLTQDNDLAEEITEETFKPVFAKVIRLRHIDAYGMWLRGIAKNILREYSS